VPISLKAPKSRDSDFDLQSLGGHLKRCRVSRKLTQKEAARQIGIKLDALLNAELGHTEPRIESIPLIVRFLGYCPFPAPESLPERMLAKRREMGWTMKEAARQMGISMDGKAVLWPRLANRLEVFLGEPP